MEYNEREHIYYIDEKRNHVSGEIVRKLGDDKYLVRIGGSTTQICVQKEQLRPINSKDFRYLTRAGTQDEIIQFRHLLKPTQEFIFKFAKHRHEKFLPLLGEVPVRVLQELVAWFNREVAICCNSNGYHLVMGTVPSEKFGDTAFGAVSPVEGMSLILHIHPTFVSYSHHFTQDKIANGKGIYPETVIDFSGTVTVIDEGEIVNKKNNYSEIISLDLDPGKKNNYFPKYISYPDSEYQRNSSDFQDRGMKIKCEFGLLPINLQKKYSSS